MMEVIEPVVPIGEGTTPQKSSSGSWKIVSLFVCAVAVYAVATVASSSRSNGDDNNRMMESSGRVLLKDLNLKDLKADAERLSLRRELQVSYGEAHRHLQINTSQVTDNNGTRFLQVNGSDIEVSQTNGTRFLQINGSDIEISQTNGTRFLQINGSDIEISQTNGTRFLQINGSDIEISQTNGTRFLQENSTLFQEDNQTRRALEWTNELPFEFLYPEINDLRMPSPCNRVDVGMPNSPEWRSRCQKYLNEAYLQKDCSDQPELVPRVYHSVSHHAEQTYHQLATSAQNPSFVRNHLSDEQAADFILENCGVDAYKAYKCFSPPAYRADMFRFCALYSQGGVYLDEDIFPFVPLEELYSPCATASVGHDFPWMDKKGKQMKILAAAPGAPIFQCALESIVNSVRVRAYPESELELTGPQMLQRCYEKNTDDVAVTYHDTRNAEWPFTGMRRGQKILAYEIPMSSKHFWQEGGRDKEDYTDMFKNRMVYKDTCELH